MSRRAINSDNLELIGAHYRVPGSIVTCVIDDVHAEDEGTLIAINTHSHKPFTVPATTVRWALDLAAKRTEPRL